MQITDISFKIPGNDINPKLVALADVTMDNQLVIKGVKIITSSRGFFVAMPVKKSPQGKFREIIIIIDKKFRQHIEEQILEAYELQKNNLT